MFHFRLFGGGDVKLLAATALWTGLELLPALLLVMGLLGGVVAISLFGVRILLRRIGPSLFARGEATLPRLFTRGEKIPYGVAIGGAGIFLASRIPLFMP
jgi:prepilin peptidase CpaA